LTLKQRTIFSFLHWKIIWIAAIVSITAVAGYFYYSSHYLATGKSTSSATTQTGVAGRGNLVISASGTGTLIPNSDATFGFKTSGQVTRINVKIGDHVEAGQNLAQLDNTLAQLNYSEAGQALQELYSAASIAAVEKEIATAQDSEYYAHEWLKYLLSPEVIEAEENLAIAQQRLAEAQAEADVAILQAAVLKVLGNLFLFRGDDDVPTGPITPDVELMLTLFRRPTFS